MNIYQAEIINKHYDASQSDGPLSTEGLSGVMPVSMGMDGEIEVRLKTDSDGELVRFCNSYS